jgi:hypothetical protein
MTFPFVNNEKKEKKKEWRGREKKKGIERKENRWR